MPSPTPRMLGGLALVAGATLLAGGVSAFSVGGGTSSSVAGLAPSVTTAAPGSTLAPGPTTAGESSTVPGATTTKAPGGPTTTATTAAPLATVSGPVGDPGQPTAEKPGTYAYDYSFSGGSGSDAQPSGGTVSEKVTTTSTAGGVTRQTVVDTGPDTRATRNRTVEWRPSGYYETQEVLNFNGVGATCTWNPAVLEAPTGLTVGKSWTLTGACQMTVFGQAISLKLNGTAHVSAKKRVMVGTDAVDVWVIPAHYTATANSPTIGTFTITFDGTDTLAARIGMVVEEDATTTVKSSNGQSQSGHIHESAKSIHPAATT